MFKRPAKPLAEQPLPPRERAAMLVREDKKRDQPQAGGSNELVQPSPERREPPESENDDDRANAAPMVIPSGTVVSDVELESDVIIVKGILRGRIQAGDLVIRSGGSVSGTIIATRVDNRGSLEGSIRTERVVLRSGSISGGTITSDEVGIEFGAVLKASLTIGRGPIPAVEGPVGPRPSLAAATA